MVRNTDGLIGLLERGNRVKYLFFWGHRKPVSGVSKSCLSQWYEAEFVVDNKIYPTAEHFMMAEKARLFRDTETEEKILKAVTPGEAKKLGRCVSGFDDVAWAAHRFDVVVSANVGKFSQNEALKDFLLNTGDRVLVEASPVDKIWGIGLAEDSPAVENPRRWKGLNLLGFALMEVRERLR